MKVINYSEVVDAVKGMCIEAACVLPDDVFERIDKARRDEPFPRARAILDKIIENAVIAAESRIPICQDTGIAVFFVNLGSNVRIEGGTLADAINEGMRLGHIGGYLRRSIVDDPIFDRKNTGDNTPAIVHIDQTEGSVLEITLLPKGGGCENMGAIAVLKPADGLRGVVEFVRSTVVSASGNPCPPVVVGVGVGGTVDMACILAKKALLRPVGKYNPDIRYARLEKGLLEEINESGVGPQGLGGKHTALWVAAEHMPCHITSMPVAVNINCHATRRAKVVL